MAKSVYSGTMGDYSIFSDEMEEALQEEGSEHETKLISAPYTIWMTLFSSSCPWVLWHSSPSPIKAALLR